ncbi:hypothetical protein AUP68_00506 [Ilyonectria robusta]
MDYSQVHDWMDEIALSSPASRNHKRQLSHSDSSPDIYAGLSSPLQSIEPPNLDAKLPVGPSPKRRRVGDLEPAEKSTQFSTPKTRGGVPNDVTGLLMRILAALDGIKVIPQSMVEATEKHQDQVSMKEIYTRPTIGSPMPTAKTEKITWDVAKELELLEKIVAKTAECDAEDLSELAWNTTVHHPFLELALAPFQGTVSHWDVTKARISEIYSPWLLAAHKGSGKGNQLD